MTAIKPTPGTPYQIDGLCQNCWLPSLAEIKYYHLDENGPIEIAKAQACIDCKKIVAAIYTITNAEIKKLLNTKQGAGQ